MSEQTVEWVEAELAAGRPVIGQTLRLDRPISVSCGVIRDCRAVGELKITPPAPPSVEERLADLEERLSWLEQWPEQ